MNEFVLDYVVEPGEEGIRLDRWLTDRLLEEDMDVSRNQVQNWIEEGYVLRGDQKRVKASELVETGLQLHLSIPSPAPIEILPDDIPLHIVYEDQHVVVVNKPRGLVVHPASGHPRGTLVNGLLHRGTHLSTLGGEMRPGVVHRIDKDTSGLVMLAKSDLAYHRLSEQLKKHTVLREYVAIVHGRLAHDEGSIDAPVGRDPRNRQRMAVVENGKEAVTHFYVEERFATYSLVRCRLETGRTHQIRVHFAYIEHPLAGDPLYGRRHTLDIQGQALHAELLGFQHPESGQMLSFKAPLPKDMSILCEQLRMEMV